MIETNAKQRRTGTRRSADVMCWKLVILFFFIVNGVLSAQTGASKTALQRAIDGELDSPLFSRTLAGIEISDAQSGAVLYARNTHLLMRPASNLKLLTSAAALLSLPAGFHFETRAFYRKRQDGGYELWVRGGGDPLFTSKDIQKIVESIPQQQISRIDAVYLDKSRFDSTCFGEGWMWDDEWSEFTPYLSAFAIDGNTFEVSIRGGRDPEIRVTPNSETVRIEVRDGKEKLSISRTPRTNNIIVEGSLRRVQYQTEKVSVWRSEDLFLERLLVALHSAGIANTPSVESGFGILPTDALPLYSIRRPLDEVLAVMNKESDNLCAELVLKTLAVESAPAAQIAGSSAAGIAEVLASIQRAGIRDEECAIADGSGISFYNLVTPAALGKLLRYMAKHRSFDRYLASLAVGGGDGTLAKRFTQTNRENTVYAKTGTVRGVSALSGYIVPKSGRRLAFVIFMQNFTGSHTPYRRVQDRIIEHCIDFAKGK